MWIEIFVVIVVIPLDRSLSFGTVWIEMTSDTAPTSSHWSLSFGTVWIEIFVL